MKRLLFEQESYYDSAFLMPVSGEAKNNVGVRDATVAMGAPMSLDLLRAQGFSADAPKEQTPNDLIIAVDCDSAKAAASAAAGAGRSRRADDARRRAAATPRPGARRRNEADGRGDCRAPPLKAARAQTPLTRPLRRPRA